MDHLANILCARAAGDLQSCLFSRILIPDVENLTNWVRLLHCQPLLTRPKSYSTRVCSCHDTIFSKLARKCRGTASVSIYIYEVSFMVEPLAVEQKRIGPFICRCDT